MGKQKKSKGPYKHSQDLRHLPANLIFDRLRLSEVFPERDICDVYPRLYETNRMSPVAGDGEYASWLNERYTREYTDNLFYSRRTNKRHEVGGNFRTKYSDVLSDPAEVSLFWAIWKVLCGHSAADQDLQDVPEERFFIVQGGIGCGKTTLLKHFSQHSFPAALSIEFPHLTGHSFSVDFQTGFSPAKRVTKSEICRRLKATIVAKFPNLDTVAGWEAIAGSELSRRQVEVSYADNAGKAKRAIIREARSDRVFVRRALHYLSQTESAVLLVFDNSDRLPVTSQLCIFAHMHEILSDVPRAFGLISLREFSLNDLGQLKGMRAYYELKTLHITTPSVHGILGRRFALASDLLDSEPPAPLPMSGLAPGFEITMASYREFLQKWAKCVLSDSDTIAWMYDSANGDIRGMIRIVRAVLSSPFMDARRIVSDFYAGKLRGGRRKHVRPWLKKVSSDEFLRLALRGDSYGRSLEIYSDSRDMLFQNMFDLEGQVPAGPTSLSGRFPVLLKYRIMDFFGTARRRSKNTYLSTFTIYGHSNTELLEVLQWFVDFYFLESKEGMNAKRVKWLLATRKLGFYMHRLTKFLIYLENVRNDVYVTYNSNPHRYGTTLFNDLQELFKFYEEILRHERLECAFMKRQKSLNKYASLVGYQPISWKLLKGCRNRLVQLKQITRESMSRPQAATVIAGFNRVRSLILTAAKQGAILPRMQPEAIGRCKRMGLSDLGHQR
jgi:hypothetical protein